MTPEANQPDVHLVKVSRSESTIILAYSNNKAILLTKQLDGSIKETEIDGVPTDPYFDWEIATPPVPPLDYN